MNVRVIVCPLCRSEDIEVGADIPAIVLCKSPKVWDSIYHHPSEHVALVGSGFNSSRDEEGR